MSLEAVHLDLAKAKTFKTAPIKHPPTTPKEYSINEATDIPRKTKILAKDRKVILEEGTNHLKFIEPKIAIT
jgi:hypothetical protein